MSAVNVTLEKDIAHIHFDDGKANVLNAESLAALDEAFTEAQDAKAVVFSGREKMFSGGLDLRTLPTLSEQDFLKTLGQFGRFCSRLLTYPRPVVAAVTGHAIAGGTVLLLCCDHRVGEDIDAKIGLSEVPIGMPLPTFVIRLAQQTVSKRSVLESILHGRLYKPNEAAEMGYLQEFTPPGMSVERAFEVADCLAKLPNPAYQLTKERLTANITETMASFEEEMKYFVASFAALRAPSEAR